MWKTSARITDFSKISGRRTAHCKPSRLYGGKLYKSPSQTCGTSGSNKSRPFSNGGAQGGGGSGAGKVFLGTTLLATGVIVGGVYYANINSQFRQTIEDNVPYAASLFDSILGKGEPGVSTPPKKSSENNLLPIPDQSFPAQPNVEDLKSELQPPPEVKISPPDILGSNVPATVSSVDQVGISSLDLDISKTVEKELSDAKKEGSPVPAKVPRDAVLEDSKTESKCSECENENASVKKESHGIGKKEAISEVQKDEPQPESVTETTEEINPLDIAINTAIATVLDVGEKAIELHEQAVTAVQRHRDSVKEALERFEKDGVSKEDWELLSKLSETKTQALEEAEQIGAKLTDLLQNVQRSITEAKENGLETSAEIASETLAKLTYTLQQVKNRLSESQAEGSVLKQFQEFIKEGKEHLIEELAAIRPEFEIDTINDKADAALLAYAQKRIRLLEDTLKEREEHEGKLLEEALQKQQNELEKLSAMKLKHELEKLKTELDSVMMQKEAEVAERHENDLRTQLRRQAAAFTDHLSDVLKVQESELNTKHGGELREKLLLAKQESELKLRCALARLNGIITAIRNRADVEKQNFDAQKLWLACHSLSTAITGLGDSRDRPYPIHSEVESIRRVTEDNEVVGKVLDSLSDDLQRRGVYTEESLRRRFLKVKQTCRQVAMVGEDGGGVWSYLISYLQSLFVFDTRIASPPTSIDPEELDTHKVLSLATNALQNGDTEQAVRYMNQLRGEPRRVGKDWIKEARLFLEVKQVARFLVSYASAYNIGVEQQK